MSKHIFTVEIECENSADYEWALHSLSSVGEITNEESEFTL